MRSTADARKGLGAVALALLALAFAAPPAVGSSPPEPAGTPVPSQFLIGQCGGGCAVDVPATNVTGPAPACRFTQQNPPNKVYYGGVISATRTDINCYFFGPSDAGYYDLSLTNDGGGSFGSSVPILVQCPPGTYGSHCVTCLCYDLQYCHEGWDGDGLCSQCSPGFCDAYCAEACVCNGSACSMMDCSACICNDGRYGTACESTCPGGEGTAQCSGHGVCDDGVSGTGTCTCTNSQFWGAACENPCPANCVNSQCQQSTGECLTPPPTASPTATPSVTPTPTAPTAVDLGTGVGRPGGVACLPATLAAGSAPVAATTNDLGFDAAQLTFTGCTINPVIGGGSPADKGVTATTLGAGSERVQIGGNANLIPDGLLYTCQFAVGAGATAGARAVSNTPGATDPGGNPIAAVGGAGGQVILTTCTGDCNGDGVVSIGEVIKCINLFLGQPLCNPSNPSLSCAVADATPDGIVSIGEAIQCINRFLGGC